MPTVMPPAPESVGLILVHGIGEQRRFEHLASQVRDIVRAIEKPGRTKITVEIGSGSSAAFHAEQDAWSMGTKAPIRLLVRTDGQITHHIHVHEVWWGDVNEPYSLGKQIRFWLWGLSVWAYPRQGKRALAGTDVVASPVMPDGHTGLHELRTRLRLFAVGCYFLVGAFSVGAAAFLLQRLLNLRLPQFLRVLTNYVSGVKLYNQRRRFGAGLGLSPKEEEFLDSLHDPPRVPVRRRMIRAIADVAEAGYDRWYIIAHSLGSVVAFNALMETPDTWPGYFDEERWRAFSGKGFGGPAVATFAPPPVDTMPPRPVWARDTEIASRSRIFRRFHGMLTLGSPLQKFAAIWPARVPISRYPAFRPGTCWVNVYDPLDPVSGVLSAYAGRNETCCPTPQTIGYAAHWALLVSHIRYLAARKPGGLADGVAAWLLTGDPQPILSGPGRFGVGSPRARLRSAGALAWWFGTFLMLAILGGWVAGWVAGRIPFLRGLEAAEATAWALDLPDRVLRRLGWN